MARRSNQSIAATPEGLQLANLALKKACSGKKTILKDFAQVSRARVQDFFAGKQIGIETFQAICKALEIEDWQNIAGLTKTIDPQPEQRGQEWDLDIDALVQEVRQRIQPYIQERCGTMRVLDMSQPIGLGDIYTNVNILEKLTRTRGLEVAELIRNADPEKFDRFCLGDVRERRVPGLKAVEQFSKLMILGKPGAGKTTFLKHLAIQCIGGKFQSDRVPVFITLKDFAEAPKLPDLLEYIDRVVLMPFDPSPTPSSLKPRRHGRGLSDSPFPTREGGRGVRSFVPIQEILQGGRALILLDGLDEVRDADSSRVLRQIQEFSQQFHQNQFVITCRIAAREYTFEQFTEVEIADFEDEQIGDFSGKWFRCKNDPIKAERFVQKLKEDEPIRELATNPLLLTLLCLVFEDSGSFPTNRAELYQNGVDVLLKKWDVKRNIEREQVYKRLSLKRKEDLLSQIARTTFEAGNYFFKQREVERYITQYIQNLPDASTDPEALELDSVAVLKSIEAQHGLFVERARGIYSLSHLTFHEYFTARKIVTSCNPYAADDPTLQGLVSHLTEKRWREVFLLTVGMLNSADILLRLMKGRIDELLAEDEKLQQFLRCVEEEARLIEVTYKAAAVRAFYFARNLILSDDLHPYIDIANTYQARVHILLLKQLIEIKGSFVNAIDRNFPPDFDPKLSEILQAFVDEVPIFEDERPGKEDYLWWQVNGQVLVNQFQKVMIESRYIGHGWKFSDAQKESLDQYYNANKLLVYCLNSDCYASREVRQELEDTLLLPIAEIQKRH